MSHAYREIEEQARSLPPEERARLAESLLESLLEERVADVEAAWEQEIQNRVAAHRRGEEEVIRGETVLAELRTNSPIKNVRFLASARRELLSEALYHSESGTGLGEKFARAIPARRLSRTSGNKKGCGQRISVFGVLYGGE